MGNSDSNFTCEGAEHQSTNTWWEEQGHRERREIYWKHNQPIGSHGVDLDPDFGPVLSHGVFERKWAGPWSHPGPSGAFLRAERGGFGSEENMDKSDVDLSHSSCPDSGFGESVQVPSPASSHSQGSSPDLCVSEDLKDLMGTGADAEMRDVFRTRVRKWSDWTGSLRIKKRRVQDPDLDSVLSFNPLQNPDLPQIQVQDPDQNKTLEDQRLSIYENFRQDFGSKSTLGSTKTFSEPDSADLGEQQSLRSRAVREGARRAGWIRIKHLIKLSKDQLELVQRRKWKKYWVKLRGCWLQFFKSPGLDQDSDQDLDLDLGPVMQLREEDLGPVMELHVLDSLVQPVPEHATKEHVFCLSSAVGQVYLLQACSQSDLEGWITSVHSVAAATASRRSGHHGNTLDFLQESVHILSQKVEAEQGVKKTAMLQLSLITETDKRHCIQAQIAQWEQSVESLSLDLFRFRSYLSSLQGRELPNPKSPLCAASRASKCMLGKLGLFNVSSLHALVCSRNQATLRRQSRVLTGQTRERRALLGRSIRRRQSFLASVKTAANRKKEEPPPPPPPPTVTTRPVQEEKHDELTLLLNRPSSDLDYGFCMVVDSDAEGRSHIRISLVEPNGPSANQGLCVGDQVVAVNGNSVSGMAQDLIFSVFKNNTLQLSVWRRRASPDPPADNQDWASQSHDLRETDSWTLQSDDALTTTSSEQSSDRIDSLHRISPECRAADPDVPENPYGERKGAELGAHGPPWRARHSSSVSGSSVCHLSARQRIRKVVEELLETEKSYVKDLSLLFDLYLTPLQHQTFLTKHEMEALFGSLPAMLDFQRIFLRTLEEKIDQNTDLSHQETPEESEKLLSSLGGSFLYYADHFKLYSGFCSNHRKVQKVLHRAKTDAAFKRFLDTRNPTNQHSASLESFLIKPVQRVLKYPLLLRELVSLTDDKTPERIHLSEALKSMEKVARHINEMQKIYEEFGPVFERLTAENGAPYAQELSMGDFLLHSSVLWLNPFPSLGRMRKEPRLSLFVFKQALILVYKDPKVKKRLVSCSDLGPFTFRWLIPASAAHIIDHDVTDGDFDLVHLRSESEGRPETLFQLSSSDVESKSLVLETLCCLLKDPPLPPLGSTRRSSLNCHAFSALNDQRRADDGDRTDQLEAQLQGLHFGGQSERGDDGAGRGAKEWRRSLVELGGALDKDYSVQSLTSIVNEDFFYNSIRR